MGKGAWHTIGHEVTRSPAWLSMHTHSFQAPGASRAGGRHCRPAGWTATCPAAHWAGPPPSPCCPVTMESHVCPVSCSPRFRCPAPPWSHSAGLHLSTLPSVSDQSISFFPRVFFSSLTIMFVSAIPGKKGHFTTLGSSEARTISEAQQLPSFLVSGLLCSLKSYHRPQRASACVSYTYWCLPY